MKSILKYLSCSAVALTAAAILPSCSMEEPFKTNGEGSLSLVTEINGDVIKTRADIEADELAKLRENCVIYIENNKGVIRKYKGVDKIPAEIKLQTGAYVAEAWSGDSVSASFSSKFYRGYQPFNIEEGSNTLTLKCNIANVVVSVDPTSFDVDLSDMKVKFWHSRGDLTFDESNLDKKGYFMMPNADKDLCYKIEGTKLDGTSYSREGVIENVERAHEYCLTVSQNDNPITEGGAWIQIKIADIPLIEQTVEIFPGPSVRGVGFNLDEQIANLEHNFENAYVYVRGYQALSSVLMSFSDNFTDMPSGQQNILIGSMQSALADKGITYELKSAVDAAEDGSSVSVDEMVITFSKDFLNRLAESPKEYSIEILAVDKKHRETVAHLRIANSADAVEILYPVSTAPAPTDDLMAIGARSATLNGIINDPENAKNYGIKYRVQGTSDWKTAYPENTKSIRATRAETQKYTVKLTGLEPGKTYEYIAFCDEYDSNAVMTFKTESEFEIPNASFEDWGTYGSNITVPGLTGDKTTCFWGSGNEGSALARMTLTDKYEGLKRTGKYSARLASNSAFNVLAAGNIFTGHFVGTEQVTQGILSLGRQYNGSHPSKVRVYCNYRPGTVTILSDNSLEIQKNGKDHGQIYIALATGPVEVRTASKKLVTPDREELIAYGEVTLKDDYGAEGELKAIEVPFVYNAKANTQAPTHLIIVATAAKYGDYFSGSPTSVMILDDFELVYE